MTWLTPTPIATKASITTSLCVAAFSLFWTFPIAASVAAICCNTDWIMIKLAPRLYLLEYVKTLF